MKGRRQVLSATASGSPTGASRACARSTASGSRRWLPEHLTPYQVTEDGLVESAGRPKTANCLHR